MPDPPPESVSSNPQKDDTDLLAALVALLLLSFLVMCLLFLTSCTLTVAPDGTHVYGTDVGEVMKPSRSSPKSNP